MTPMRNVAICVWDEVELLDFSGPGEVFAVADECRAFRVYTVGVSYAPIMSQGFVRVMPEYSIDDCPRPDIVVLPGGGAGPVLANPRVRAWLKDAAAKAEIVLSVCTGAFVLAGTGLLDGLAATTWYGDIDRLRAVAPRTVVHADRRFVDNGRIVTSAGVSAGIDAALHVVARLHGMPTARATAQYMEYEWHPERYAPPS